MKKSLFPLLVLVVIGLCLRLDQVLSGNWYIISDKGRDVLVASHLAYSNIWQTAISPHSGGGGELLRNSPFYYMTIAFLYRMFPNPTITSAILATFSVLLIVAGYIIGMRFAGFFGAVITGVVFATSFVMIDYSSHLCQIMTTPMIVGVIIWAFYEAYMQKEDLRKLLYCLVSVAAIFMGLLTNHSLLGVLPVCMCLWVYFLITVRSVQYRLILISGIILGLTTYIGLCHIDITKLISATHTSLAGGSLDIFLENFQSRTALFYSTLKASRIIAVTIPVGIVFWFCQKRRLPHQRNLIIVLTLLLVSGLIAVSAPHLFYEHYFLPYYAGALLLFSLLLSVNTSILPRILAAIIVTAFVVSQLSLLREQQKNHFSLRDAGLIADVIRQSTLYRNNNPFSIVLPTAEMEGIERTSEWNSGGIWYALEQKTGRKFVEIVPEEKSLNNIYVPGGGSRYIVICFDNPPSKFFRLDVCLSDWGQKTSRDLRYLSHISVTNNTYYIYETY